MFMVIIIIINVKLIIITNVIGPSFITIFMFIIMKDRKHFFMKVLRICFFILKLIITYMITVMIMLLRTTTNIYVLLLKFRSYYLQ